MLLPSTIFYPIDLNDPFTTCSQNIPTRNFWKLWLVCQVLIHLQNVTHIKVLHMLQLYHTCNLYWLHRFSDLIIQLQQKSNQCYWQTAVTNIYYQLVPCILKHLYNHNEVLLTSHWVFTRVTDDLLLIMSPTSLCTLSTCSQSLSFSWLLLLLWWSSEPFISCLLGSRGNLWLVELKDVLLFQAAHQ